MNIKLYRGIVSTPLLFNTSDKKEPIFHRFVIGYSSCLGKNYREVFTANQERDPHYANKTQHIHSTLYNSLRSCRVIDRPWVSSVLLHGTTSAHGRRQAAKSGRKWWHWPCPSPDLSLCGAWAQPRFLNMQLIKLWIVHFTQCPPSLSPAHSPRYCS